MLLKSIKLSFVTEMLKSFWYINESKIILFFIDWGIPIVPINGLGVFNLLYIEQIFNAGKIERPFQENDILFITLRRVAQLGRALRCGRRGPTTSGGRRFWADRSEAETVGSNPVAPK